jgi:hypothetical protein
VLVTNIDAYDELKIPGYSATAEYTFEFKRIAEPDAGDLNPTTADSNFVKRPLQNGGAPLSALMNHPRTTLNFSATMPYTAIGTGRISYEGDNDFFIIPLPPAFATVGVGLTLTVEMPSSPVDIGVQAWRSSKGAHLIAPNNNNYGSNSHDDCDTGNTGNSCNGSTCDSTRKTCTQSLFINDTGSESTHSTADAPEAFNRCHWLYDITDNNIYVQVKDVLANDWDEVQDYKFTLVLNAVCPAACLTLPINPCPLICAATLPSPPCP